MKQTLLIFSLLIMFSSFSQTGTLIVLNKSDDTVDLIDLESKTSVAKLPTGDGPHEVAVSPNNKLAVVTNYGRVSWPGSSLTLIDIADKSVIKTISLTYKAPHGIEFISQDQVLVTCEGSKKLIQVNVTTGKIEKAIDTNQETSHMVAYSSLTKKAFVTNIRSGSVSVIDMDENVLERILKTGQGAEGVALAADGKTVWISNRGEDTITVLDASSLETIKVFRSEKFPIRVKLTSDGKYGLVSNAQSGDLKVFDVKTFSLVKTVSMEVSAVEKEASRLFQNFEDSPVPVGILVDPDNKYAFVANTNADIITVINLETLEVSGRLTAGKEPDGLGFSTIKLD